MNEGYLQHNPVAGIVLRAPKDPLVEPYHLEHIKAMMAILDHDWEVATIHREKMLAARNCLFGARNEAG